MSNDKKFFPKEQFNKLDWSKLKQGKFSTNGDNYSFGKGGTGYRGGQGWHLEIVSDDFMQSEEYELPEPLSKFMDWLRKDGADEKMREIKRALGII